MWVPRAEIKSLRLEVKGSMEPSGPTPHLRDEESGVENRSDLPRSMCEEPKVSGKRPTRMTAMQGDPKTTEAMSPQALLTI